MAVKFTSFVWASGPRRQADFLTLLALADYANDAGLCWPGIEGLCIKARLSDRALQRSIRRLEADGWLLHDGWIEIDASGRRRNTKVFRIKTPHEVRGLGSGAIA